MKGLWVGLAALLITPMTDLVFAEPIRIVTTTELGGSLARVVGGDHITVESLVKGDQDPHFVNPQPSLCVSLNKADLLVAIGQGLEQHWLLDLITRCRNHRIEEGREGYLDLSREVKVLPLPQLEETSQGWFSWLTGGLFAGSNQPRPMTGVLTFRNPYYWLDPANGEIMARTILTKLISMDPANADQYRENYEDFAVRLKNGVKTWDSKMEPFRGVALAAYGIGWVYLAERHGLKIVGFVEPQQGQWPRTEQKTALIATMKGQKAKVLLMESYQDQEIAKEMAQVAGAEVLVLPSSVDQAQGIMDYLQMFEVIYDRLSSKLSL
ncbi:MAG: metal ABC transporter substrate-binding protein [Nitrospira sp.]|nr:metal ABC transporter substrate-binding protein [Nitrospira sp.]